MTTMMKVFKEIMKLLIMMEMFRENGKLIIVVKMYKENIYLTIMMMVFKEILIPRMVKSMTMVTWCYIQKVYQLE